MGTVIPAALHPAAVVQAEAAAPVPTMDSYNSISSD